jgi:MFS family permease
VVAEIVPTSKRSLYAALILCTIIPWSPGTLYANWMTRASWRWIGCALAIWNVLTLIPLAIFYHPPPRVNSMGLTRKEIVKRIDFVGGAVLTIGLVLFLIGLNWGGQDYPWKSAHVISFLVIGLLLMVAFGFWEAFGAPYPLYPRRIIHAPRPLFCLLFVIFAAGINYMPLVVFWPIESISVFDSSRYQLGINTLPIGICILGGAILSALLMGIFKGHVTFLMTTFCVIQTVGKSPIMTTYSFPQFPQWRFTND